MSGDAAEALTRGRRRAAQAAKQTPEPVVRLVPDAAPHSPPPPPVAAAPFQPLRGLVIDHASEEPTSPTLDVKGAPPAIATFDGTLDFNAVAHTPAKAAGVGGQEGGRPRPPHRVAE